MKIGILGGTFDPIHIAHVYLAERVLEALSLDEVWFIPAYQSPFKTSAPSATPEQRLEMVRLSIEHNPRLRLIDTEIRRGGTSYTYDTMVRLKEENPTAKFYFIVGTDILLGLARWYKIEELLEIVTFVSLARPGFELRRDTLPEQIWKKIIMLPTTEIDVSSTEIRDSSADESIRSKVSKSVYEYIKENKLYDA